FYYEQPTQTARFTVISTALLITSTISTLAVLALILLRVPASQGMFGSPQYGLVVGMFSVQILTHALENYALSFIRIQQKPWLFISISIAKMLLQLLLNIWFVVLKDWGVLGVAA